MTRTIETDVTTSWTQESTIDTTYDWIDTENGEPIETEDLNLIELEQTEKIRAKEQDNETSRTFI